MRKLQPKDLMASAQDVQSTIIWDVDLLNGELLSRLVMDFHQMLPSTSSLDAQTEKLITNELDEIMKGKTVIYCVYWLSSIINIDKIHVLKDGYMHETSTHHELLNNEDSVYSEMWYNYLRESTVDDVATAVVA